MKKQESFRKIFFTICIVLAGFICSNAATFTVTQLANNDYGCGGTPNATNTIVPACVGYSGSLGWAIASANANVGADIIDFNLPSGSIITVANPAWLVITDGNLTINATINGMAAAWATNGSCGPVIRIDNGFSNGFDIRGVPGVKIKGLCFNMTGYCVTFSGAGVTSGWIQGCYGGLNMNGTTATTNIAQSAIQIITAASGVIIGGATCDLRNVFLGNNNGGVDIAGASNNNQIIGNYFNTNAAGTAFVSPGGGQASIRVTGSTGTIIGTAAAGNIFAPPPSGQGVIYLETNSDNTSITNCYVNIDVTGTNIISAATTTTHGILIDACKNVTITNCVIGGMPKDGIHAQTAAGLGNMTLQNSFIGTDKTGMVAKANGNRGVFVNDATTGDLINNNVISGNGVVNAGTVGQGIMYNSGCGGCTISNNYIGVDATGNNCLPNGNSGIFMQTAATSGTTISNNYIGCNGYNNGGGSCHGVQFFNGCSGNTVGNNFIGIGKNGTSKLGNSQDGVSPNTSCNNNTIINNNIGNNIWGVFIQGSSTGNMIYGNNVGIYGGVNHGNGITAPPAAAINPHLTNNEGGGICAQGSSNNTLIGGATAGQGNTVFNNLCGIHLRADPGGVTGCIIYGNNIQNNKQGLYSYTHIAPNFSGVGVAVNTSSTNKIGGPNTGQPNTIYNNDQGGVWIDNSQSVSIRRNSIYCNGKGFVATGIGRGIILTAAANAGYTTASNLAPGPLTPTPAIVSPAGIVFGDVPSGDINATDVVEVFYDPCASCQGKTYLGDATNGGTGQWAFPGTNGSSNGTFLGTGSIPPAGYCTVGAGCVMGIQNITATRTDASNNTSEFMSCASVALSVDYISFTVKKYSSSSVILNWVTGSEKNNGYFEILRSRDGKNFIPVGKVSGAGNSIVANSYSFIDEGIDGAGIYYYALAQVDFDGRQSLSAIHVISFDLLNAVEVVPNSVYQGESVKILNFTGSNLMKISVIDLTGKVLIEKNNLSDTETEISTTVLSPALYIIRIQTQTEIVTKKLVVQ